MSKNDNLEGMADAQTRKMFPDRPTEEVVAEIVAADPLKHGVTVEERKRRALEQARAEARVNDSFFAGEGEGDPAGVLPRDAVAEVGGDGNGAPTSGAGEKPAHAAGPDAHAARPDNQGNNDQVGPAGAGSTGDNAAALAFGGIASAAIKAACDHKFPDDAGPETPCSVCGMTFREWAES